MKRLILMMPLIASGCADFSFNSNLDKENFDEYFKPGGVQIYEQNQLADLNYLYLGTVEGESCQSDAKPVSYTHLTLPTIVRWCRSRWSPYH